MKILMLGWELPPHNSGGLGTACYQLCKALSENNLDIEFVVPYEAEHDIDFMKVTAARPEGIASLKTVANPYDSNKYVLPNDEETWLNIHQQQLLYEQAVVRLAEERDFDLVHAHDWLTFRAAVRIKEQWGCPVVMHVHSVESDRAGHGPGNRLVKEIEEVALHLADRVIAVSQHTKDSIVRDYGVPSDKIEVIHNSIEYDDVAPLPDENAYQYLTLMKELGYKVVVNVGRLTIQKGLPNLLKAASAVIERSPKTMFLIVGSGEQYNQLVEQSANLGIGNNVLFADFQRGKPWRDAFMIGDLFVMPSVSEPFGLTPLEAAGYGTPSLISKQSGVSEVLKNCLKVDYWDTQEMANQILAVMQNDALRAELSAHVSTEYENLSWINASKKVSALYKHHLPKVPA